MSAFIRPSGATLFTSRCSTFTRPAASPSHSSTSARWHLLQTSSTSSNNSKMQIRALHLSRPLLSQHSPYETLGVRPSADTGEIKKKYRELAKKYHPDLNPDVKDAADKMREITDAYSLLMDKEKRAFYDQTGQSPDSMNGGGAAQGEEGNWFTQGPENWVFSNFSDLFGRMAGGFKTGPAGSLRGADLSVELGISFRDAVNGCRKSIPIDVKVGCETCNGSGCSPGTGMNVCPHCKGTGVERVVRGPLSLGIHCSHCNGNGQTISHPCRKCTGSGITSKKKDVKVDLPAGVRHDMEVRITGAGHCGARGGPAGHLYVKVQVSPDPVFRWIEDDIHCDVGMSLKQSLLGGEVKAPTLDGTIPLKIDPNTSSGTQRILRGKGPPRLNSGGMTRGHQVVHLFTEMPSGLTQKQREIIEEFDRIERARTEPTRSTTRTSNHNNNGNERASSNTSKGKDKQNGKQARGGTEPKYSSSKADSHTETKQQTSPPPQSPQSEGHQTPQSKTPQPPQSTQSETPQSTQSETPQSTQSETQQAPQPEKKPESETQQSPPSLQSETEQTPQSPLAESDKPNG